MEEESRQCLIESLVHAPCHPPSYHIHASRFVKEVQQVEASVKEVVQLLSRMIVERWLASG